MVIRLDDVSVSFRGLRAVDGVELELPPTGIVGLIGPNGAGKSSLLDALSGFVKFEGKMIDLYSGRQLGRSKLSRRFARLHQVLVLPERLGTTDYLAVAANPSSVRTPFHPLRGCSLLSIDPSIEAILGAAKLETSSSTELRHLSWGQQRVIALAGILMAPKPHLLLDEPFSGLAPVVLDRLLFFLAETGRSRLIVVAEHDLDLLLSITDYLIVMANGGIQAILKNSGVDANSLLDFFTDSPPVPFND